MIEVGRQTRGFDETKMLSQPFTHFVANRPASLVVDLDVVRDSVMGFHFAISRLAPRSSKSPAQNMFRVIDVPLLENFNEGPGGSNYGNSSSEGVLHSASPSSVPNDDLYAMYRRRFNVPVQRPHHSNSSKYRWPVVLCGQQQCFHGSLPFRGVVFAFR